MLVLLILGGSIALFLLACRFHASWLARHLGEDAARATPACRLNDGRDYVPTPTPVVFAHHFASIAGAGPIVGPVMAIAYGWLPALVWVVFGGILIGAVHDYLATYMATREGGQSVATIVRRILGVRAFVAITIFLVVMLALVCAAFLNLSATALTSMLPFERIGLAADQTLFRVVERGGVQEVVIGGIASMSVVVITLLAPLVGFLYLKKSVAVWKCSLLAILICAVSIAVGVWKPIALTEMTWKMVLSAYVLVAAGVPVWIFLQSRDFINVHILYVGMAALIVTLVVAALRGSGVEGAIPMAAVGEGTKALGPFWPGLFIVIACGAVSGFHSLCAGGTTCKQLKSEPAARQIGYWGMLLESFLAVCVITVLLVGATWSDYAMDVHPVTLAGLQGRAPNAVLGFAMAVGNAVTRAFGLPVAAGALAGMVLLEGFLVTTLDTAVRLTRYLIEEVWRALFGRFDVFALQVGATESSRDKGPVIPAGADGIPSAPAIEDQSTPPPEPVATSGIFRAFLRLLRTYWVNSGLAVGLMLAFALTGGQKALWMIFATSNQLLAAFVLALASLWLARQGKKFLFALVPAVLMVVTTVTSLGLMLRGFLAAPGKNAILLTADVVIMIITAYLLAAGALEALRMRRGRKAAAKAA